MDVLLKTPALQCRKEAALACAARSDFITIQSSSRLSMGRQQRHRRCEVQVKRAWYSGRRTENCVGGVCKATANFHLWVRERDLVVSQTLLAPTHLDIRDLLHAPQVPARSNQGNCISADPKTLRSRLRFISLRQALTPAAFMSAVSSLMFVHQTRGHEARIVRTLGEDICYPPPESFNIKNRNC